jgi:hypothetical protein
MADSGPRPLGQVNCPVWQRLVYINQDGRVRHHRKEGGGNCPGGRQPAPGGSVVVRKLADGVVVKVCTHPAPSLTTR